MTGLDEKQYGTGDDNGDTYQLGRRGQPAEIALRIIAAEHLDEGAQNRVAHQVRAKYLAIEFFVPIKPGKAEVERHVQQRIIYLCRMHWRGAVIRADEAGPIVLLPDRGPVRISNRPRQTAHAAITTAIHQTTDAAEHITQCNAGREN